MTTRRKHDDWIWVIAESLGVLLLFALISPHTRQVLYAAGLLPVCLVSITGTSLIGYGIYRFVTWSQAAEAAQRRLVPSVEGEVQSRTGAIASSCDTEGTTALLRSDSDQERLSDGQGRVPSADRDLG